MSRSRSVIISGVLGSSRHCQFLIELKKEERREKGRRQDKNKQEKEHANLFRTGRTRKKKFESIMLFLRSNTM